MAGIIAVYSLVIAVLIAGDMEPDTEYELFRCVTYLEWTASEQTKLTIIGDLCT